MYTHIITRRIAWVVMLVVLLFPWSASAQMTATYKEDMLNWIANGATYLIVMVNMLTWIFFIFLNFLLDPEFIFNLGGGSSLMEMLNKIWVLSRDLMNIAFAVILVGAAVYVVVKADKSAVTEYVPKFVLSVIFVNFSWFAPLLIIDVANIATATIYGIPSMLAVANNTKCEFPSTTSIPGYTCQADPSGKPNHYRCTCKTVTNAVFLIDDERTYQNLAGRRSQGWRCQANLVCIQLQDLDATTVSGHSAILNGLIVNHARLMQLATAPAAVGGTNISQLLTFVIREGIILVIQLALFFPLLAMLVAFTIRIPILWLTIAFMPFVFLQFVVGEKFTQGYPQKIWEYFLKAAFLPALVAIPLSIGFILINAGAAIVTVPGKERALGVSIRILDGVGSFWELLWLVMTLGVLWVGVFTVLKDKGIMSFGVEAIKGFGETVGKIAIKAPLSIPAVPLPGGSLLGVGNYARSVEAQLSRGEKIQNILNMKPGDLAKEDKFRIAGEALKGDRDLQVKLNSSIDRLITAFNHVSATESRAAIDQIKTDTHGHFEFPDAPTESNIADLIDHVSNYAGETIPKEKITALKEAAKKFATQAGGANAGQAPAAGGSN